MESFPPKEDDGDRRKVKRLYCLYQRLGDSREGAKRRAEAETGERLDDYAGRDRGRPNCQGPENLGLRREGIGAEAETKERLADAQADQTLQTNETGSLNFVNADETANAEALRETLVAVALEWERRYAVAPAITCAVSEFDAALLVGQTPGSFSEQRKGHTAVTRGTDFTFKKVRYQVKANRPSGKPGSKVTLVGKARNYEWDKLVWILYDQKFRIVEAWEWDVEIYKDAFDAVKNVRPDDMRGGRRLDITT